MNPESLVPSRETCERLRDAGWDTPTFFSWNNELRFDDKEPAGQLKHGPKRTTEFFISWAPTLAEVLEQLPELDMEKVVRTYRFDAVRPDCSVIARGPVHTNPAEAAAQLWLKVGGAK